MATEQFPQVHRLLHERSSVASGSSERAASRRSTTLRSGIRARHVYGDAHAARSFTERLADERLAIVSGSAHLPTLDGRGATTDVGPFLTTVLMTDIVESTDAVTRLGDRRWRELLAEHYAHCRAHVARRGGEFVTTTGDGIVAIFDTPTRAVRAATAIQGTARELGIAVRAGVHTGECARLADGLAGVAVHIAARICALAGPDEVITTGTVRDLMMGSRLAFDPRGRHELRGVPGDWLLFKCC
jgi:class 3 adenylate cyclase